MSKLLVSILDVPLVLLEVVLDDVSLDADVGDDVLWVVLDLVRQPITGQYYAPVHQSEPSITWYSVSRYV